MDLSQLAYLDKVICFAHDINQGSYQSVWVFGIESGKYTAQPLGRSFSKYKYFETHEELNNLIDWFISKGWMISESAKRPILDTNCVVAMSDQSKIVNAVR